MSSPEQVVPHRELIDSLWQRRHELPGAGNPRVCAFHITAASVRPRCAQLDKFMHWPDDGPSTKEQTLMRRPRRGYSCLS